MDTNPYQSPLADAVAADHALATGPLVDGKCLVLVSGTILPAHCVRTNQAVTEGDMTRKRFDWAAPWVALLILVNVIVLLLVYFLVRKKCFLTFGLHPSVRRKYRNRLLLKALIAIALFFAIPVTAAIESTAAIVVAAVLFIVAVVSLFIGNSPLRVVRYREGKFWIKGFSDEYLASIAGQ